MRELYGPDDVRIVWKHCPLPFHQNARPAAEVATGVRALAGNAAFWTFTETVFSAESRGGQLDDDHFTQWARLAGVTDVAALLAGLQSHRWGPKIDADLAEATAVGVQGTPAFFINGVRLVGAQPYEAFRAVIDQQLAAARAKIAAGESPERVYAVLSRENRAAQPPDKEDDEEPADTKTVFAVPIGASPTRGPATAPVTIVEFADYQCSFCVRAEPVLQQLRTDYGDKLRFVFRNEPLPFHQRAEPAAEAVLEVRAAKGDAAFWAMHDALLDGAADRDLGDDALAHLAESFGAKPEKVRAAIAKHLHSGEIEADGDAADDFQVDATPHFFINGRRLVGAQPKEAFAAIIDEEIAKAQALVAAGTKPAGIYDRDDQGRREPARAVARRREGSAFGRSGAGRRGRQGRHPRVCRLSVPVLPTRRAHAERSRRPIRRQGPLRVARPAPLHPRRRRAPPRGPRARRSAARRRRVLDAARPLLRRRRQAQSRRLGRRRARPQARHDQVGGGPRRRRAHGELKADESAAESLGFEGTPTFLVVPARAKTGYVVVGAQRYAKFRKLIDRAIAEAVK